MRCGLATGRLLCNDASESDVAELDYRKLTRDIDENLNLAADVYAVIDPRWPREEGANAFLATHWNLAATIRSSVIRYRWQAPLGSASLNDDRKIYYHLYTITDDNKTTTFVAIDALDAFEAANELYLL